jgi:hypothetical protein
MRTLTEEQEQSYTDQTLRLIRKLRSAPALLSHSPETERFKAEVDSLVRCVNREIGGVTNLSQFIHGVANKSKPSDLPNAIGNGNISSQLAIMLKDLYIISRIHGRVSKMDGARQRLFAILDEHEARRFVHDPSRGVDLEGQTTYSIAYPQAQQPRYQRGGEEPYQSRHFSERTEHQRARRIAHHRADQEQRARQGMEPDSDDELLGVFSEGFDSWRERQRDPAASVTESQRQLHRLSNVPQNTTRGTQTGTRQTGSTSFALPGGAVVSSSRPSRGNTVTLANRHLEDLLARSPSPEQYSIVRKH